MAKKMQASDGEEQQSEGTTPQNVDGTIQDGFRERLKLENEVAALEAQHIKPLKDKINKLKKNMSANSGIDATDLNNFYRLYKRQEEADTMEEGDRDRIQSNMRQAFGALRKGEMLDFIDMMNEAA